MQAFILHSIIVCDTTTSGSSCIYMMCNAQKLSINYENYIFC